MELKLIKYGADWCHMCKQLETELNKETIIIPHESIDVETLEDEELDSLNIRNLPVLILLKKVGDTWETVHRWNGFIKATVINDYIKGL